MSNYYPATGWHLLGGGHTCHMLGCVERYGTGKHNYTFKALRYKSGERKEFDRCKAAKEWVVGDDI